MTCEKARGRFSGLLDDEVGVGLERGPLSSHLAECRECETELGELRAMRAELRKLAVKPSPPQLASRLRVVASQELARRQGRPEFSSGMWRWWTRSRLTLRDLMRPLALPAAGGLLSSVVCFAMLVSTFGYAVIPGDDVPLGYYTQVSVDELSPFGFSGNLEVELTIDKEGRVSGYSVPHGVVTREDLKQLGNLIIFTRFSPATAFGSRLSGGKILVKSHHINVRG